MLRQVFIMHWDALLGTWGLLISYGLSSLPLSYLYSFAFDGPSSAQISIAGVNFLSGFGFVIAYAVLVREGGPVLSICLSWGGVL